MLGAKTELLNLQYSVPVDCRLILKRYDQHKPTSDLILILIYFIVSNNE